MVSGSGCCQDSPHFLRISATYGSCICKQIIPAPLPAVFDTAVPPVSLQQTYWENSSGEEKNAKEYEAIFLAQFQTVFSPE